MSNSKSEKLDSQLQMAGGSGKDSYCQNSTLQGAAAASIFKNLDEALQNVQLPSSATTCIHLADLGCSSGPNCIRNMNHIVQTLRAMAAEKHSPSSEVPFQLFFNDLPKTDFNNLFQLLTGAAGESHLSDTFVAGVPGSFFERLFPSSSIHVFFTSSATQFLSKVPDEVLDKNSAAYNKQSDWLIGATPATIAAYKKQASDDLKSFLHNRATELAPGGLLFISMPARRDDEAVEDCAQDPSIEIFNCINRAIKQLFSEEIITEDALAAFNIPVYFRSEQEVLQDLQSCSGLFKVIKMQIQYKCTYGPTALPSEILSSPERLGELLAGACCASVGPLLQIHFGKQNLEGFKKILKALFAKHVFPKISGVSPGWVIALIRTDFHPS